MREAVGRGDSSGRTHEKKNRTNKRSLGGAKNYKETRTNGGRRGPETFWGTPRLRTKDKRGQS